MVGRRWLPQAPLVDQTGACASAVRVGGTTGEAHTGLLRVQLHVPDSSTSACRLAKGRTEKNETESEMLELRLFKATKHSRLEGRGSRFRNGRVVQAHRPTSRRTLQAQLCIICSDPAPSEAGVSHARSSRSQPNIGRSPNRRNSKFAGLPSSCVSDKFRGVMEFCTVSLSSAGPRRSRDGVSENTATANDLVSA